MGLDRVQLILRIKFNSTFVPKHSTLNGIDLFWMDLSHLKCITNGGHEKSEWCSMVSSQFEQKNVQNSFNIPYRIIPLFLNGISSSIQSMLVAIISFSETFPEGSTLGIFWHRLLTYVLFWYPCWVFWIRRLYFYYKVHFKLGSPTFLNQGLSLHWAVCQHFMIPLQLLKWAYFSKQSDTINRQKVRNEAFVPCRWHMCVQNV